MLVASSISEPFEIISNLPRKVENVAEAMENENSAELADVDLKIAWRYSTLPKKDSVITNHFDKYFDLSSKIEAERLSECDLTIYPSDFSNYKVFSYEKLWRLIKKRLDDISRCSKSSSSDQNLLRIAIQGSSFLE